MAQYLRLYSCLFQTTVHSSAPSPYWRDSIEDVVLTFDAVRRILVFPDGSTLDWDCSNAASETALGVGLWLPSNAAPRVAFVKDGVISRRVFPFAASSSSSSASNHHRSDDDFFLPVLSRDDLDVNWGQTSFRLARANAKECKILASSYFYKRMIALS